MLSVIASREAVDAVCSYSSNVKMVVGAMDVGVDSDGCIVPGMGSFDERYFRDA